MPKLARPRNILGRGVIDPVTERRLLARGIVHAHVETMPDGRTVLITSKRPWKAAMADFARSLLPVRRTIPAATQTPIPA